MKTLGKLKLNEFRKAELEKRELNALKGGCQCKCACAGVSAMKTLEEVRMVLVLHIDIMWKKRMLSL